MTTSTNDMSLSKIVEAAQDADAETRVVHQIEVGKWVRQGDVILLCVSEDHKFGRELTAEQGQLAAGQSTGARHIAELPAKIYEGTQGPSGALLGPCVRSDEQFRVSHPEHADIVLPSGTYQTIHQMDTRTRERVMD